MSENRLGQLIDMITKKFLVIINVTVIDEFLYKMEVATDGNTYNEYTDSLDKVKETIEFHDKVGATYVCCTKEVKDGLDEANIATIQTKFTIMGKER